MRCNSEAVVQSTYIRYFEYSRGEKNAVNFKEGKTFIFPEFSVLFSFPSFNCALFSFNFFSVYIFFICLSSINWWMLKLDVWAFLRVYRCNPLGFIYFCSLVQTLFDFADCSAKLWRFPYHACNIRFDSHHSVIRVFFSLLQVILIMLRFLSCRWRCFFWYIYFFHGLCTVESSFFRRSSENAREKWCLMRIRHV